MVNQWLCVLFQMSAGPVMGLAMDSMQTAKNNPPPKWMRVGTWVVVSLVGTLFNVFWKKPKTGLNYVSCLMTLLGILVCRFWFYQGSFRRQFTITMILVLGVFTAELVTGLMIWLMCLQDVSMDYRQADSVWISFMGSIVSNTAIFFLALVWRRFKLQKSTGRGSWTFAIMLLCLIPTIPVYLEQLRDTRGTFASGLHILAMTGVFFLNLLLIFVQFHQAEKEEAEKALEELKRTQAQQKQHYESMEARREEMAKLRHDYNNHLSSVLGLVRMGNRKEAEAAVKALLQKAEYSPDDRKKERDT